MEQFIVKSSAASASHVFAYRERRSVQAHESVFGAEDSTVLCSVPLQGDVGPPGAEGEQGQEGMRVSDCKQPTNPFLPCGWVNLTRPFIYSPSLWQHNLIPPARRKQSDKITFV